MYAGFQESDDETEIDSAVARVYEVAAQMVVSQNKGSLKLAWLFPEIEGPQYRPPNIIILIMKTLNKVPLILGNLQIGFNADWTREAKL